MFFQILCCGEVPLTVVCSETCCVTSSSAGMFFYCPVKALSHEITIAYKRKFSWPYPEFSVADPGCLSRIRLFSIPDPGSELFLSRIPDFNPKKWFLSFMKHVHPESRIRILTFYPSRIPDPGVKKAPDPGPGSATLPVFFGSGLCPIGVGK